LKNQRRTSLPTPKQWLCMFGTTGIGTVFIIRHPYEIHFVDNIIVTGYVLREQ
jgi:hypothetical protein